MSKIPPPPPGFVMEGETSAPIAAAVPPPPPGFQLMDAESPFADVQAGASSTDRMGGTVPQRSLGQRMAREVGGLGLRNVVEGSADLVGTLYDPIAAGVNWLGEKAPTTQSLITGQPERYFPRQATAREAADMALNALGVPRPETARERVYGDVGRALTQTALTMGAGALAAGGRGAMGAAGSPTVGQ